MSIGIAFSNLHSAKTQSGWQSRVHIGQKINLVRSLFFMHGLQVQQLMITAMWYLGASGFRDMPKSIFFLGGGGTDTTNLDKE